MTTGSTPRVFNLDCAWAESFAEYGDRQRRNRLHELQTEDDTHAQLTWVRLGNVSCDLGLVAYALGAPESEVRRLFAEAARAYLEVFRRRGTLPAFAATMVRLEPDCGEGATVVDRRPVHLPGARDQSLTNSRRGLRAMFLALAVGDAALAQELAALVEDPPGASYLGVRSVVCTLNEQRLAYAVKALLLGKEDAAGAELQRIKMPATETAAVAPCVRFLTECKERQFLEAISNLLDWHRSAALNEENRHVPDFFLCLPALALRALALRRQLVRIEQLPDNSVYLPLAVLSEGAP